MADPEWVDNCRQHVSRQLRAVQQHAGRQLRAVRQHVGRQLRAVRQHVGRQLRAVRQHAGRQLQAFILIMIFRQLRVYSDKSGWSEEMCVVDQLRAAGRIWVVRRIREMRRYRHVYRTNQSCIQITDRSHSEQYSSAEIHDMEIIFPEDNVRLISTCFHRARLLLPHRSFRSRPLISGDGKYNLFVGSRRVSVLIPCM